MKDDTVVALRQPESFADDPLTEILRAGARQLLGQAIEAEVAAHIEAHADLTDASGRRRIVRHGHMPEREVQTGIGAVTVKRPRVRDRDPQATGGRIRFTSWRLQVPGRFWTNSPRRATQWSLAPAAAHRWRPSAAWSDSAAWTGRSSRRRSCGKSDPAARIPIQSVCGRGSVLNCQAVPKEVTDGQIIEKICIRFDDRL